MNKKQLTISITILLSLILFLMVLLVASIDLNSDGVSVGVNNNFSGMELDGKESYNFTIKTFEGETITLRDYFRAF